MPRTRRKSSWSANGPRLARLDDPMGQRFADARQLHQLRPIGRVDVHLEPGGQARPDRSRSAVPASRRGNPPPTIAASAAATKPPRRPDRPGGETSEGDVRDRTWTPPLLPIRPGCHARGGTITHSRLSGDLSTAEYAVDKMTAPHTQWAHSAVTVQLCARHGILWVWPKSFTKPSGTTGCGRTETILRLAIDEDLGDWRLDQPGPGGRGCGGPGDRRGTAAGRRGGTAGGGNDPGRRSTRVSAGCRRPTTASRWKKASAWARSKGPPAGCWPPSGSC